MWMGWTANRLTLIFFYMCSGWACPWIFPFFLSRYLISTALLPANAFHSFFSCAPWQVCILLAVIFQLLFEINNSTKLDSFDEQFVLQVMLLQFTLLFLSFSSAISTPLTYFYLNFCGYACVCASLASKHAQVGRTALGIAKNKGHTEIVALLEDWNGCSFSISFSRLCFGGVTEKVLDCANTERYSDTVAQL